MEMLVLAEHLRPALDQLEADEDDPDGLARLYQVDHSITRMRRASRDLRVLAGRGSDEVGGYTSSLTDVIRVAQSSIERYTQVSIGTVVELATVAYAADDVASLLAALLDNATRYSPSTVTVSAHLIDDGSVMYRIEDAGIGIAPSQLAMLNNALAGPVPEVSEHTTRHTGFAVVHRLARKHGIRVRLASRAPSAPAASSGTIAMAIVPPQLLCEIPAPAMSSGSLESAGRAPAPIATMPQHAPRGAAMRRSDSGAGLAMARPAPPEESTRPPAQPPQIQTTSVTPHGLPQRESVSLHGRDPEYRRSRESTRPEESAADSARGARSFAEDLDAFSSGGHDAGTSDPTGSTNPAEE